MISKFWKLGAVTLTVPVGAALYFSASSASLKTTGHPTTPQPTKVSTSSKPKITTQPTVATNAPPCSAAQLAITTPAGVDYPYIPNENRYLYAIGMNQVFHAKVIENTSAASCSLGGGVPRLERIVVTASRTAAMSTTSAPLPDGVTINIDAQPPTGPVFNLAPAAKAEIWYGSNSVKPNPAADVNPGNPNVAEFVSCIEVFSIPTPAGSVTVPGPIQKCGNYQPQFLNNYGYFFPSSQTLTKFLPNSDVAILRQ
jgi:hypothetical protein